MLSRLELLTTQFQLSQKAVIHALIYRPKEVRLTPEILAKEMDYLHRVLKNNYPDWMIKI